MRLRRLARAIGWADARRELAWILKHSRPDAVVSDMLDRRITGEPLQYILGNAPFGPLDLLVRPPVLIPRPETEDWAIRLAHSRDPSPARPLRVLDLCTGSGCIPLLLCHLWPKASVAALAVDVSQDAIRLAADNASRCGTHDRNTFTPLLADIRDPAFLSRLDPPFDVITANPPYVPIREYHALPASVKDHEDPRALIGDLPGSPHADGLSFYRVIAALLARDGLLAPRATIALEVGHDQAHAVAHILRTTPGLSLGPVEIWQDPWKKDRVVLAHVA